VNTRQCSELQRWLDHPVGTFNADLTVPLDGLVPDYAINARVIDVRIGGFNANREPVRLRNALLSHPGVSFVRMEDSIVRETFRPAQTSSLEWPATWDLDAVAGRWNTAAQPRRLPFEGYGLQTAWQLTLRPWTGSVALDRKTAVKDATYDPGRQSGLFIRFVYNHQIRTKENVFATEQRSSNCRVVLSLSGPARLDFAPIIVSPAMAALASTQIAPVGLPLRPGSDGTCPRLPTELSSHSFAGNLRATPASAAERETRIKQESLDLLASCVGKPRRGVRFERVAGMWFGSQYEDLANSLRKGIDGANTREDVCNKLRQGVGLAWWTK
jgi:hypothetical protein